MDSQKPTSNEELVSSNSITLAQTEENADDISLTAINDSIDEDFISSRQNIRTIIETGMATLQNLARLAEEAEHPNVYRALSEMMTTLTAHQKMLMDMDLSYKKHLMDIKPTEKPAAGVNIQNAMFVGSTADLLKQLKGE